jgi:hypothetical protein
MTYGEEPDIVVVDIASIEETVSFRIAAEGVLMNSGILLFCSLPDPRMRHLTGGLQVDD